jgi:C-terminal processing protease CtpA/Prc
MRNVFRKEAAILWAHKGTIYKLWNDDTLKLDQVLPYPKKVSVIINQNVASSAEMFLLKARQSSKVKLYGANTIGAVDYADAVPYKMPCPILTLRISSSRNCRVPAQTFDYIGIKPDVSIPEEVKDWQQFVCEQRK